MDTAAAPPASVDVASCLSLSKDSVHTDRFLFSKGRLVNPKERAAGLRKNTTLKENTCGTSRGEPIPRKLCTAQQIFKRAFKYREI